MTSGRHAPVRGARSREDLLYFQERAEQEIRRAELAHHPEAVRVHYELAAYYLDLVHNPNSFILSTFESHRAGATAGYPDEEKGRFSATPSYLQLG